MVFPQLRILVVEHDSSTTSILARLLRREGHDVSAAQNGEEAIAIIRRKSVDLLIADIGLPDISGWDLLREIRGIQEQIQAIALTGHGDPEDLERSRAMGFNRHLTKPAHWQEVRDAIHALYLHPLDRTKNLLQPEDSMFGRRAGMGAVL